VANRSKINSNYKDNRRKFKEESRIDEKRYKHNKRKKNHKRDFLDREDVG